MSDETPGKLACIAWNAAYAEEHGITARNEWAASDPRGRAAWQAAAEVVAAPLREQLAIATTALDANTLAYDPYARDTARKALDDIGSVKPCPSGEAEQLREQLDDLRERLGNFARGLELSAARTAPSKKSEIESACADGIREIASRQ